MTTSLAAMNLMQYRERYPYDGAALRSMSESEAARQAERMKISSVGAAALVADHLEQQMLDFERELVRDLGSSAGRDLSDVELLHVLIDSPNASAVERREAAASRLITALSWFWTVYTVSALVGTALYSANLDVWVVPLVLSPIATLSAAYLCALWALNPIVGSIRQTESDAQALWSRLLDQKLRRLRLASALLVLSDVLILASGIVVATSPA